MVPACSVPPLLMLHVPLLPLLFANVSIFAVTSPPPSTSSVPLPELPTLRLLLLVHIEPVPLIAAVPVKPELKPRYPEALLTCPPASMVNVPLP